MAEQRLQKVKDFSAPHTSKEAGGAQGAVRGYTRAVDARDIPYHRTSYSACKSEERRRNGGTLEVTAFVFPSHHYA